MLGTARSRTVEKQAEETNGKVFTASWESPASWLFTIGYKQVKRRFSHNHLFSLCRKQLLYQKCKAEVIQGKKSVDEYYCCYCLSFIHMKWYNWGWNMFLSPSLITIINSISQDLFPKNIHSFTHCSSCLEFYRMINVCDIKGWI